jgi:hypothetical protein
MVPLIRLFLPAWTSAPTCSWPRQKWHGLLVRVCHPPCHGCVASDGQERTARPTDNRHARNPAALHRTLAQHIGFVSDYTHPSRSVLSGFENGSKQGTALQRLQACALPCPRQSTEGNRVARKRVSIAAWGGTAYWLMRPTVLFPLAAPPPPAVAAAAAAAVRGSLFTYMPLTQRSGLITLGASDAYRKRVLFSSSASPRPLLPQQLQLPGKDAESRVPHAATTRQGRRRRMRMLCSGKQ